MRLIELRANKESFKTVRFNRTGLSIIVAKKRTSEEKNTYNSVGKSLCVALVHFCLASKPNKELEIKLPDWEFELDFEVDGINYTSSRNTSSQNIIALGSAVLALDEFRHLFGSKVFNLGEDDSQLSFRSLIARFIRPSRSSYSSYNTYITEEQPYNKLLNTSYLLGLDTSLVREKYSLKKQLDQAQAGKKIVDNDASLKEYFQDVDPKNLDIEIFTLESQIDELDKDIANFKVAENYTGMQNDADRITRELRKARNDGVVLRNALVATQRSLESRIDISTSKLLHFFEEAKVYFSDTIVHHLKSLESFHENLIAERTKYLLKEKSKFEKNLSDNEEKIQALSSSQDEALRFLNSHGALADYSNLAGKQNSLRIKLEKLKQYDKILKGHRLKKEEIKKDLSEENLKADKYLNSIDEIKRKNVLIFNQLANSFYDNKSSGISIENNTGENQIRFNVEARIQDDKGDAVSEVKIFCFDWTLLKGKNNHSVDFIFHDSRILDGMDSRQIATLFKTSYAECKKNSYQYIISANHNTIESVKAELTSDEFLELITKNEVLELNDISDEGKLLGIQVDLNY
jgi:uncharacterized protein YydD (DUF2326 family)